MPVSIVPFDPAVHGTGLAESLLRLRLSGRDYPPSQDAPTTLTGLRAWLFDGPVLSRWVAVADDEVAGHVQLTEPHDYLVRHFLQRGLPASQIAEVGKLWTSPNIQNHGVGQSLLERATQSAFSMGRAPVLAVLPSSEAAIRLYHQAGWTDEGAFEGIHGKNLVMIRALPQGHAAP